jgi:hypothetical protein
MATSHSGFPPAFQLRMAHQVVQRVDATTGKVSHRRVRRRRALCDRGGLAGGYALLNDGPAFASQLTAALFADS